MSLASPGCGALCPPLICCALLASSLAHGQFTFVPQPPVLFPSTHFPTMTTGADLNGNGLSDLISPGRDPEGLVHILRNLGDGIIEIHQTLELGGHTDWASLGDLDGNGQLDLALAVRSGPRGLAIRYGVGDGTFTTAGQFLGGARDLRCVELVDLNLDGSLDAVAADYVSGVVRIYRNEGPGGALGTLVEDEPIRIVPHAAGFVYPSHLTFADLDGSGAPDLVVTSTAAGRVTTLRNRGDGTFEPGINRSYEPVDGFQPGLLNTIAKDFDGDGAVDLATPWLVGFLGQLIAVSANDGAGNFDEPVLSPTIYGSASFFGTAADLDGDGLPDLAVGHALSGVLSISRNVGDFQFAPAQSITIGTFVRHVLPIDMNGNGVLDLVLSEAPENFLQVLINTTEQASGAASAPPAAAEPTARRERPDEPIVWTDDGLKLRWEHSRNGADIGLWLQEQR